MNTKLQILKEVTGENFHQINEDYFKSDKGEIFISSKEGFLEKLIEICKKEIPFLENNFLLKYLPEKFNNFLLLEELKELCKFDHTLLSNFIDSLLIFVHEVSNKIGLSNLFLDGSEEIQNNNYYIFYLKNE